MPKKLFTQTEKENSLSHIDNSYLAVQSRILMSIFSEGNQKGRSYDNFFSQ